MLRLRLRPRKRWRHHRLGTRREHVPTERLGLLRRLLGHGLALLEHARLDQPLEDLEDLLDPAVADRERPHRPLGRLGNGVEPVDQRSDLLVLRGRSRDDERAREVVGNDLPLVTRAARPAVAAELFDQRRHLLDGEVTRRIGPPFDRLALVEAFDERPPLRQLLRRRDDDKGVSSGEGSTFPKTSSPGHPTRPRPQP